MTSPASLNTPAVAGFGVFEKTVHLCLRSRLRIQSPFLVFDKLSSAAEDHTGLMPATAKGDHHFDLEMPGTFSRLHQRSPDSGGL
jgi:hypothetical protein